MPAIQTTSRPGNPQDETPGHDRSRRRRALVVVAVLAALTLGSHLVARRVTAVPAASAPPAHTMVLPPAGVTTAADGAVTVSARLDRTAVLRGGDGVVRVELALAAAERPGAPRVPTDLVVVLDRSGSMGGEKLAIAQRAIHELVTGLAAGDRFALVVYSDWAEHAIPLAEATTATRESWRPRIDAVGAGGGTNLASGLDAALALAAAPAPGRARRILLLSDGLANQGDASFEGLIGRAAAATRHEAAVTAVGVGLDFDERLMGAIADAGTGNYYYLRDGEALAGVFARELEASRETVASAVAVVVETPAGVELVDAAGYPFEQLDGGYRFHPGNLFAGQERRLWLTLRLPTGAEGDHALGRIATTWEDRGAPHRAVLDDLPRIPCVASEERFLAGLDGDAWAASVTTDAYARLEGRVAGYVREGRREEAQAEIEAFATENRTLNAAVASPLVEAKLEDLTELAAEVDDAFVGADQASKQNVLSKERQAASWDGRRSGAKKLPEAGKAAGGGR